MATYNGDSIADLNASNPDGQDTKSQGDDAIREIKTVLKNHFPNAGDGDVLGVTLAAVTSSVGATIPLNSIIPWWGTVVDAESVAGYTICDGRARPNGSSPANSPDLRGKFIVGARTNEASNPLWSFDPGFFYGKNYVELTNFFGDLEEFTTNGTALTVQNIPDLTNYITVDMKSGGGGNSGLSHQNLNYVAAAGDTDVDGTHTNQKGPLNVTGMTGTAHTHDFTISEPEANGSNIPETCAIIYLIKD